MNEGINSTESLHRCL